MQVIAPDVLRCDELAELACVVALARAFGLQTVAEGVEDAFALDMLVELGVDYAQGYHIARPGPLDPQMNGRDHED